MLRAFIAAVILVILLLMALFAVAVLTFDPAS